jgi:ABC-type Fe3+ transport system permease subunit
MANLIQSAKIVGHRVVSFLSKTRGAVRARPKTPGEKAETRLNVAARVALLLVILPFVCSFLLVSVIVYKNATLYLNNILGMSSKNVADIFFAAELFSITMIVHLMLLYLVYMYMMANDGSNANRFIVLISKIGMSLPVAFFGYAVLYLLRLAGIVPTGDVNILLLCSIFAVGLVPTSVSLFSDHIPIAWEGFHPIWQQGIGMGAGRYYAILSLHLVTKETRRYLVSISMFSSLRIIAEISFFKEVLLKEKELNIKEFTMQFFGNLNPDQFAYFGLVFFVIGILGLAISFVVPRV